MERRIPWAALNSGKRPSIPEKWRSPQKWSILTPKKVNLSPEKKSLSPNPYENPLFAKNGVQIGQNLPLWAYLYFTPGYRGLPPCTLSQHPDNRETGYSNVLSGGLLWYYYVKIMYVYILNFGQSFFCVCLFVALVCQVVDDQYWCMVEKEKKSGAALFKNQGLLYFP